MDAGIRNPIKLEGAKLQGQYVHGNRARKVGTLGHFRVIRKDSPPSETRACVGWETMDLNPGVRETFTAHMNATFHRDYQCP